MWWLRLMAGRRKPPPQDGPRQMYARHIRMGISSEQAARLVAESYGLKPNVVFLKPDGSEVSRDHKWTIRQIERLLAMKWEAVHGLGGPQDGAAKWPHYIDGYVEPP